MRFVGVSIALLLTLITPTLAQSAKHQPVFIFGEGLASCGEFLQKAETKRKTRPASATATQIYDGENAALIMYAERVPYRSKSVGCTKFFDWKFH
jgi:hypothetical protein